MKICSRCKQSKELSQYHNRKSSACGKSPQCKLCTFKAGRIYRAKKHASGDWHPRHCISEEIGRQIITLYQNGELPGNLAKKFEFAKSTVIRFLKEKNLHIIDVNSQRKHKIINENYFETLDSAAKAYFLGLLWADGCNYRARRQVMIALQERDRHILEEFCLEIFANTDVLHTTIRSRDKDSTKRQNQCCLRISNAKISNDLLNLGMIPRKSLSVGWPTNLPPRFYKDFIRGVYDGDGGITGRDSRYTAAIVGSVEFIAYLKSFLQEELEETIGTYPRIYPSGNRLDYLKIGGKFKVKRFLDWLYAGATHKLNRKYEKYLELKKVVDDENARKSHDWL